MSFNKITIVGNLAATRNYATRRRVSPSAALRWRRTKNARTNPASFRTSRPGSRSRSGVSRPRTPQNISPKARSVYIEGRLRIEEWTDRDNNNRYTLDVQATDMQFISSRVDVRRRRRLQRHASKTTCHPQRTTCRLGAGVVVIRLGGEPGSGSGRRTISILVSVRIHSPTKSRRRLCTSAILDLNPLAHFSEFFVPVVEERLRCRAMRVRSRRGRRASLQDSRNMSSNVFCFFLFPFGIVHGSGSGMISSMMSKRFSSQRSNVRALRPRRELWRRLSKGSLHSPRA